MSCKLAHFKVIEEEEGNYEYIITFLFSAGEDEYEHSFIKEYYYKTTEKPYEREDIRRLVVKENYDDILYQKEKVKKISDDLKILFGMDKDICL